MIRTHPRPSLSRKPHCILRAWMPLRRKRVAASAQHRRQLLSNTFSLQVAHQVKARRLDASVERVSSRGRQPPSASSCRFESYRSNAPAPQFSLRIARTHLVAYLVRHTCQKQYGYQVCAYPHGTNPLHRAVVHATPKGEVNEQARGCCIIEASLRRSEEIERQMWSPLKSRLREIPCFSFFYLVN